MGTEGIVWYGHLHFHLDRRLAMSMIYLISEGFSGACQPFASQHSNFWHVLRSVAIHGPCLTRAGAMQVSGLLMMLLLAISQSNAKVCKGYTRLPQPLENCASIKVRGMNWRPIAALDQL